MMLTEFFLVKDQDSAPSEGVRYKKGRMGDLTEKFHMDDEISKVPMDFYSTFTEVSRHGDVGSSAVGDQVDRRTPQGDDRVERPFTSKSETDTMKGMDPKRTDENNAISVPAGLDSTQKSGKDESAQHAIIDPGAIEQISSDHTTRGCLHRSEMLKADEAAGAELKSGPASAENGNSNVILISSGGSPANKVSGSVRHTAREANLIGIRPVRSFHDQISTETAKSKPNGLKIEMTLAKDKGAVPPVSGSGSSSRLEGQIRTETAESKPNGLKIEMALAKDKGAAPPVSESGSSRRLEGQIRTETAESKPNGLKIEMTLAKDKGAVPPVSGSGSSSRLEGQVNAETGKNEVASSRASNASHGIRPAPQGFEKAWLSTHPNEVISRGGEFMSREALSVQEKKRPGRDSAESSGKGSASREMTFKSSQTGLRDSAGVGELRETGKDRKGKEASRFDLARDGQDRKDTSKINPGEQRVEATGEKIKEETGAARFTNRVSTPMSEQGFDRTAPKSEASMSDNPTFSAGNTSSSTKSPGSISRFAEMETVRQSFQESGVRQLVEKAALNLRNGQQEFRIELKPESLGQVKVQVSTENHQVTIRIMTELPLAKEMIENNLYQLKAELQGQGLEIDTCEVSLSQNSDKSGVEHGFTGSKRMKRGYRQRGDSKAISSTPDVEREDWARHPLSGYGAINLFA